MANGELATQEQISPATLEAVIVNDDLSRLSPGPEVGVPQRRPVPGGKSPVAPSRAEINQLFRRPA